MFSLGLEFSFKKLVHVGGSSSVAAVTEAIGMCIIGESGIRRNAAALVAGIERNGNRILNPDSTTVLEAGDLVWIVEEKS